MQLTPEVVRWCQFIGFLLDRNESAYRRQTDSLVTLCMDLCLKLTPVEITVDFKMKPSPQDPRYLHDCRVESMKSSRRLPNNNINSLIKKSTAEDVLPAAAEEIQPAEVNDGTFLLLHHCIYPHLLHHNLICCHRCLYHHQHLTPPPACQ